LNVLIVLVFVSIVLVAGGLLLFVFSMHQRDFEHAERLSLLPLEGAAPTSRPVRAPSQAAPVDPPTPQSCPPPRS
jgi:hypothetical protein